MTYPGLRTYSIRILLAATVITLGATLGAAQTRDSRFDGAWSVVIVTDSGACDRTYRYGVRIQGGQVFYEGSGNVAVSGQVTARGFVQVRLREGDAYAEGSGRLNQRFGEGQWSGEASNQRCMGHWQAERESYGRGAETYRRGTETYGRGRER